MAPLKPWKTRITKTAKSLEDLIERSKPLTSFSIPNMNSEEETIDILKGKEATITTHITNIEKQLESLKQAQSGMEELFKTLETQQQIVEESSFEEYMDAAAITMSNAEEALIKLSEKQTEINTRLDRNGELEERRRNVLADNTLQTPGQRTPMSYASSLQAQGLLPRLQLPKFSGNKREWDAFWAIFKANIDDQPIPLMMKFNYLLQALTGEARQVADRYQVSEDNFSLVVEALKHKYGRDSSIVEELFVQLENTVAKGPSTAQQISLLDQISAIMAQLATKGQDTNHRLLLNTVLKKFEPGVQLKALEKREQLETMSLWTWQTLYSHLSSILELKERIEQSQKNIANRPMASPPFSGNTMKRSQQSCIYCKRTNHPSKDCRTVPITERVSFLNRNKLCLNCAKANHNVTECRSQGCFRCGQKHHSTTPCRETPTVRPTPTRLIPRPHPERVNTSTRTTAMRNQRRDIPSQGPQNVITLDDNYSEASSQSIEEETQINQVSAHEHRCKDNVVLLTGTATIEGPQGPQKVRILLDTGSKLSFVDAKLVDEMKLPVVGSATLRIKTFGSQTPIQKEHRIVKVNFANKEGSSQSYELYDNDVITNSSQRLQLTEEDYRSTSYKNRIRSHGIGKQYHNPQPTRKYTTHTLVAQEEKDAWDRYWAIESAGTDEYTGPEKTEKQALNEKVIKSFKETVVKKPEGYYVRLPWKENHAELPDNKAMAIARLRNLFKQYSLDELQEIKDIFQQQLQQGIIEQVTEAISASPRRIHYLPYQVINRPDKSTTPKRVVFDASAHPRGRPSLNDVLYQGPLIMPTITGMLMRFAVCKIATIADIEKAFLQVHLHENDRDVTRFLWVHDITQPPYEHNLVTYRFTRVTFGLNSSPFLLAATIHFHLDNCLPSSEITAQIKDNLYVDNLIMTAETTEEAIAQYRHTKEIFNSMKMNMREYISNDKLLMNAFEDKDKASDSSPKVLGIEWKTDTDHIVMKCAIKPLIKITKRTVLHANASIYDPLGWLSPLMIRNKYFFQSLWKKDYNWDDPLQEEDQNQWRKLCDSITGFYRERPRKLINKGATHQLVAFSDASTTAMAAFIYVKQKQQCKLLIAKTKLPSIKANHTVPKLELNALTLAARLTLSCYRELSKVATTEEVYLFSDSEIVLNWVKNANGSTKALGVLVNNRIKEIRNIVDEFNNNGIAVHFGYTRTTSNPSDCATRGLTAKELQNHIWWEGPDFLKDNLEKWPSETRIFEFPHENSILHISTDQPYTFQWNKFSSMKKLERTVAWALRFIWKTSQNLSHDTRLRIKNRIAIYGDPALTNITAAEMRNAHHAIILMHQNQFKSIREASTQNKLNIQQDHKGIWRCWGRLGKSHLSEDAKNPVFIAPNTDLAKLIILQSHGNLHRSTAHTIAEVRSKYWIPHLRQQVKRLLRACVPCQRFNNFPFRYPPMADIPERRVIRSRPFKHVGFDLFGPLKTRTSENVSTKAYGSIFTCATTRLIHLELLSDASTTSVLNAIRRFIARRGIPSTITCDNAPTFALAEQILEDGRQDSNVEDEIQSFLANSHIHWQRITPDAPWKGGFYERLIKDVKRSLLKTLGRKTVSTGSLLTILAEIEGSLNSRPLTYQETDLNDITPIRPIDFLQNHLTVTYNWDVNNINIDQYLPSQELASLQTRQDAEKALKSSCALVEKFWNLWSDIYLKSLREHHTRLLKQGRTASIIPRKGQVVLLQDPFQPRNCWKLAKIIKLPPSQDEYTRKVELLLPNRHVVARPITALVPLELGQYTSETPPPPQNTPSCSDANMSPAPDTPITPGSSANTAATPNQPSRYRLRDRTKYKNYPYDENEFEVNALSSQIIQIHYRMDRTTAAVNFIRSLSENTRSLLDEKEIQRRLDIIYITNHISNVDRIHTNVTQLRQQLDQVQTDKAIYQAIMDTTCELEVVKQKMIADYQQGEIFWEIYRLLVEAGGAKKSSKYQYETKKRPERRENTRTLNNTILQREIEHVNDLLTQMSNTKVSCYVEFPKENVVLDQLTHIRTALESPRGTLNSVENSVEIKNALERIEHFMERIDQRLTEMVINQKVDVELLLDSQINAMVQLKRAVDGLISADETDETKMDEESFKETHEPEEMTNAKRRLQELDSIKYRSFGRRTLLIRDGCDTPKCSLCSSIGEHDADMCYKYKTVADRKRIAENSALCRICLQLCPDTCILPTVCSYCGSATHNSALCNLPEEKLNCLEIVRRFQILGGQCADALSEQSDAGGPTLIRSKLYSRDRSSDRAPPYRYKREAPL